AEEVITALNQTLPPSSPRLSLAPLVPVQRAKGTIQSLPAPTNGATDPVATREPFGEALAKLGGVTSLLIALDADVKNSTYADKFWKRFPDRFFENFIAEQNMVGTAAGLAACGKIPFAATFACFLTRAYDFIRMAAISQANIKLMGSHVGVSIGE